MAITFTDRFSLHQWSDPADAFPNQADLSQDFARINQWAARDEQGVGASRPANGIAGRWYFATDARKRLYREDGAAWHEVPLIAQQNDFTGGATHALASDGVTQDTASYAPVGVTRNASASNLSYFALARSGATVWGLGVDSTNRMIMGAPTSSKIITTPRFYFDTSGNFLATGPDSRFGANAAGAAGSQIHAGSFGDGNNAYVAAEGNGTNVGLVLRGQGAAGSVVVQPTSGSTVATFAPAGLTVTGSVSATTVTAAAGPTGSSPFYANAPTGLTAQLLNLQKNAVTQAQIDNAGQASFGVSARTGYALAARRDAFGVAVFQNGADASNSNVAVWGGDAGLLGTGTGGLGIIVSGSTGGPGGGSVHTRLGFKTDRTQLLTSNGSVAVEIDNNGNVTAKGADHYFGLNAFGGSGNMLHLIGNASGSGNAIISAEGTDANVALVLKGKGAGSLIWTDPTAANTKFAITSGGTLQAPATDHYFGTAALGATGKRLHILTDATWSKIFAEDQASSSANGNLWLEGGSIYNKLANGSGEWRITDPSGNTIVSVGTGGTGLFGPSTMNMALGGNDGSNLYFSAGGSNANIGVISQSKGTGVFQWYRGTAPTFLAQLDASLFKSVGADTYFGAGVGSGGNQLHVTSPSAGGATTVAAENSNGGTTTSLVLKSQGTAASSGIAFYTGSTQLGLFESIFTLAAKSTNLWIVRTQNGSGLNQSLQQVTVGAADSGGSGYSVLRVPN